MTDNDGFLKSTVSFVEPKKVLIPNEVSCQLASLVFFFH
jgi:hypothetical protein